MEIRFELSSYTDKDNMVLALVNNGYTVSAKFVNYQLDKNKKYKESHWLVTVHNYKSEEDKDV